MSGAWQIRVFHDGECPLCQREVRMLQRLDRGRSQLLFEDISRPDFDASRWGVSHATLMGRIHGELPDGQLVEGVEVFRRAYAAVGLGWLVAPTRWPGLRTLFDALYRVFARNRLRLTGRRDCNSGSCAAEAPLRAASE